ncbi:uncharacterized protein LOC126318282 [Schistocerca gregaria]|uniref:uncharacterized protein LOC126318282 n=1 Tax=Schistocerca gregaria TaxID=7010 RepID=UPI00211DD85F|nr:uncharacterized protein LOC126318282 [Schistocerca gregaria]
MRQALMKIDSLREAEGEKWALEATKEARIAKRSKKRKIEDEKHTNQEYYASGVFREQQRFTGPENSAATAAARESRECHHDTPGRSHRDGVFASSSSSRPPAGTAPAHTAAVAAFFIWFMAAGGGRVPFWSFCGGRFCQSAGRKLDVPCSHSFLPVGATTLRRTPQWSHSIQEDSSSLWGRGKFWRNHKRWD